MTISVQVTAALKGRQPLAQYLLAQLQSPADSLPSSSPDDTSLADSLVLVKEIIDGKIQKSDIDGEIQKSGIDAEIQKLGLLDFDKELSFDTVELKNKLLAEAARRSASSSNSSISNDEETSALYDAIYNALNTKIALLEQLANDNSESDLATKREFNIFLTQQLNTLALQLTLLQDKNGLNPAIKALETKLIDLTSTQIALHS